MCMLDTCTRKCKIVPFAGNNSKAGELPGAALFCLSFSVKDENNQGGAKVLHDLHAKYENALLEIAAALQLSRNIHIALLSLQSWKPFLQRWLRACIMLLDVNASSGVLDTTSKAADDILKCIRRVAEKSIPRSAENIALAVGAFCLVLPSSAHATKATASKFLLSWLFQHEHEYRQWPAAVSLGVITSCLHVTDHKQKLQNINALLEVASSSKSTLVRGACGVALGYSCQDLITRFEVGDDSNLDQKVHKMHEVDMLGRITRTLCQLIGHFAQSSATVLQSVYENFLQGADTIDPDIALIFPSKNFDYLEEDIWGVSGLVMGLGSSVPAMYRSGCIDGVTKIKNLIISWIPHLNPLVQNTDIGGKSEIILSVGACLALPFVVAFAQKVELIDGSELEHLLNGYRELISELLSVKKSGAFLQSLLMASCVGAGNLLACILNEGVHSVDIECVNDLLALFKKIYSNPHPPPIHLGAMLGVVNALGAGAGTLFLHFPLSFSYPASVHKESSYITGPLLSNAVMEPSLTSSIQEIFLVAQHSDDHQLQDYAAWAVSFLRHYIWSKELRNDVTTKLKAASQSFPDNSIVMKLSLWLTNLNCTGGAMSPHVNTVVTVLRCLTHAPRLPQLDWGAIIRRCMRYEDQVAEILRGDSDVKKGKLREECLIFALAHASKFDALLAFLDELSDLSRFKMLEVNLQLCILSHLPHLSKIFSGSRLEKLFDDVANFMLVSSDQLYSPEQKSLVRASCWKGLCMCLGEASLDSKELMSNIENCMEVLFYLLPEGLNYRSVLDVSRKYEKEEWSEAIRCLGKARRDWLWHCLQIPEASFTERDLMFVETKKKIMVRTRLVQIGSIPLIELGKLKHYVLNTRSEAIWDVLVELAMGLQDAEGSAKRQWLVDAVEISCVTCYPSTVMQFIGLLCGSFSVYMPLLIMDPHNVLSDLPVTLGSLLSDGSSWGVVAESVALHLWTSTSRIYDWVTNAKDFSSQHALDESEKDRAPFLLKVMHHTCVTLKDYLPPEKQLLLANLVLP